MLSEIEKNLLKEFLAQIPYPEEALSYHELMGFMYGLAITPEPIPEEEWVEVVFGDDVDTVPLEARVRGMSRILTQIYEVFHAARMRGELHFPYQVETLMDSDLEEVLEWSSGFEEALALRPDIWESADPEEMDARTREELFFSIMILQGLNEPDNIMPFFDTIPDDMFSEAFATFETDSEEDRELQVQAFLLAALPLAVRNLQKYGISKTYADGYKPVVRKTGKPKIKKSGKGKIIKVDFATGKKR